MERVVATPRPRPGDVIDLELHVDSPAVQHRTVSAKDWTCCNGGPLCRPAGGHALPGSVRPHARHDAGILGEIHRGARITGSERRSEERRVGKECRSRWAAYD